MRKGFVPNFRQANLRQGGQPRRGIGNGLGRMDRATAEEIAIQALGFLTEEPQRLTRFMALTGLEPADLGALAASPSLQMAVLDHILADETLLLVFAADKHIDPEHVLPAQMLLSQGHATP